MAPTLAIKSVRALPKWFDLKKYDYRPLTPTSRLLTASPVLAQPKKRKRPPSLGAV
jgi:hypothetical protein